MLILTAWISLVFRSPGLLAQALAMEAFEDFVWLRVVALSGRGIISVRVPRQISGEEIYDVAGSGFADGFSFKLLYEEM